MAVSRLNQVVVDLVGKDLDAVALAAVQHSLQLLLGPDPAHRVVGRAEDKRLYVLLYDLPLKLRQVDGIHPRLLL